MAAPDRRQGGAADERGPESARTLELVCDRLRIVAEPTRVGIMRQLDRHGGSTVQEVADAIDASHQTASRHLNVLYGAGLVNRASEGRRVRYELVDWTALWVVEKMTASVDAQLEGDRERFQDI